MKEFIIETDLGHDPDDLFCICHLAELGMPIKAIGLVPGNPEQVTLACGLRKYFGLDCEIGRAKSTSKSERLGIHDIISERHGWEDGIADGTNAEVFSRALAKNPESDLLVIGPAPGLGVVANQCRGQMVFQGGFLPYSLYRPNISVPKMEGYEAIPTFNFNGNPAAIPALLKAPLSLRRFCGKNVCHSIILTKDHLPLFAPARNLAGEIYIESVTLYLERHEQKKMHDPTALVCHLHPEIATWVRGQPIKRGGNWTTVLDPDGDYILADVDRDLLWQHILERT